MLDYVPTIAINNGNIVGSEVFRILIGYGEDIWLNSPIENDTLVNVIGNRFGVLLFDNPSYSMNIRNNKIVVNASQSLTDQEESIIAMARPVDSYNGSQMNYINPLTNNYWSYSANGSPLWCCNCWFGLDSHISKDTC